MEININCYNMKAKFNKNSTTDYGKQSLFTPHGIALIIMWFVSSLALVVMLKQDVRNTEQFSVLRYSLQIGYVLTLLWYLSRNGPSVKRLPAIQPQVLPKMKFGKWIPALIITLLLTITIISDYGTPIIMLLLILATLWILVVWRREIKLAMVFQGFVVAIIALLAVLILLKNNFVAANVAYLLPALVPLMYIAGCLLIKRNGLGRIQLVEGKLWKVFRSFFGGCILFIPLGLFNAAEGSLGGSLEWVNQWWMPFAFPLFSGIAEETWYRLFLISLVYFLLKPAFPKQPAIAIIATVLFSAITFGLGHGRNMNNFLTTGLLYGLPMSVVFVRRDWEHSVGTHYMVNMIPWVMAFLES